MKLIPWQKVRGVLRVVLKMPQGSRFLTSRIGSKLASAARLSIRQKPLRL
jgi:hypothetical protein